MPLTSSARQVYLKKRTRAETKLPCRRDAGEAVAARSDILPYERAKLSAVKVDVRPLNLSGLTDNELAFLRRVMLKQAGRLSRRGSPGDDKP
jgi:hypothetical protein